MDTIAFVVLHYNVPEVTRQCVDSIRELQGNKKKKIVIVDNASPDGSGILLEKEYAQDGDIKVLVNKKNEGFARGNNRGYRYAREAWKADCVIVLNNDIIFEQSDFLTELENLAHTWESDSVGVVGPDIVTLTQQHQNPFRQSAYKMADVKKAIRNKTIFLWYFYLKKFLHLENRIFILENMFEHKSGQRRSELAWDKKQDNVVLQGACLIFLPAFVKNEENAFCKDTFLYGEEDVLHYLCEKKGYGMQYTPSLRVRHLEGQATKKKFSRSIQKSIFIYRNTLNSLGVLKKLMESDGKEE